MTARPQSFLSFFAQSSIVAAILLSLFAAVAHAQPSQAAAPAFVNTLMPLPATLESKPGELSIDSKFSYALKGDSGPRLAAAAGRFIGRLETHTGVQLAKSPTAATQPATLSIEVATAAEEAFPQPGEDESYTLDEYHDNAIAFNQRPLVMGCREPCSVISAWSQHLCMHIQ